MPSLKRKAQDISLQRRIRARREPSETPELDLISAANDTKPTTTTSEDGNDSENNDEDRDEDNEVCNIMRFCVFTSGLTTNKVRLERT